ncbi:MAG: hypothetical protein HFJ29_00910 [Clostridia bacterium]|nr:hypothetical protein [Clostridia bacterium]
MSNEITLKLKCGIEEIIKLLESQGFKIVGKYFLDDTYYIPSELKIEEMTPREILSKAVLLRDITEIMPQRRVIKLTFKSKNIDNKGNILEQSKTECKLYAATEGKSFLQAIGYIELMNIKENGITYEKEKLKITIKDVKNGDQLVEVETVEENSEFDTIENIKQKISELQIPIDTNDYFIKKAEIELSKKL